MASRFNNTDWVLAVLFFVLLGTIVFGTFFSWDFHGVQDNRVLAKKPDMTSLDLTEFPTQFEAFFNDHLGFRNTLIRKHNKMMIKYFGHKPKRVTLGKNDWLFFSRSIPDYLGYYETKKEDLERWRLVLEGRRAWLKERGIQYLFVIPPNKQTICSEYLPREIYLNKGATRLEQFLAYMKENSDVPILDLRPELFEAKKHFQVYLSTDTHWNGYGAFVAYQQVVLSLKRYFPDLPDPMPLELESFVITPRVGDLIHLGGLEKDDYPEVTQTFRVAQRYRFKRTQIKHDWILDALSRYKDGDRRCAARNHNPENTLRAVFFHDSFMVGTPILLARNFTEVYALFVRAEYDVLKNAVDSFHPHVVIDEVLERFLYVLPDDHPEWMAARDRSSSKKMIVSK